MKKIIGIFILLIALTLTTQGATLISIPDFVNKDNLNQAEQKLANQTIEQIKDENPDAVLVPGDLIMGRYYLGDVEKQMKQEYKTWKKRWGEFSPIYPAIGDHELGDLPLVNYLFQSYLYDVYLKSFSESFNLPENGSSATYYFEIENTLVITINTFRSGISPEVSNLQLLWIEQILKENKRQNIIVQGHLPILSVDKGVNSSKIQYKDGRDSELWRLFKEYNVDLYLCGEFHTVSFAEDGGVQQIVHGGWIGDSLNYLLIDTDRLDYEIKRVEG